MPGGGRGADRREVTWGQPLPVQKGSEAQAAVTHDSKGITECMWNGPGLPGYQGKEAKPSGGSAEGDTGDKKAPGVVRA